MKWQVDNGSLESGLWISKDCDNLPTWIRSPPLWISKDENVKNHVNAKETSSSSESSLTGPAYVHDICYFFPLEFFGTIYPHTKCTFFATKKITQMFNFSRKINDVCVQSEISQTCSQQTHNQSPDKGGLQQGKHIVDCHFIAKMQLTPKHSTVEMLRKACKAVKGKVQNKKNETCYIFFAATSLR